MSARYAIFFCPQDCTPLARYGERVLGRSALGNSITASESDYPDRALAANLSATPAHYGFHATLKAPFHLRQGQSVDALLEAVDALTRQHAPIVMHTLEPRTLSGFAALVFATQPEAVMRLASQCVEQLEDFRAALTDEDIQRRQPDDLSKPQRHYLQQYGYPFVMSEFRFHMTLSGPLDLNKHAHYVEWLDIQYRRLVTSPPLLDRLAVFWQSDRNSRFTRLAQFPFDEGLVKQ